MYAAGPPACRASGQANPGCRAAGRPDGRTAGQSAFRTSARPHGLRDSRTCAPHDIRSKEGIPPELTGILSAKESAPGLRVLRIPPPKGSSVKAAKKILVKTGRNACSRSLAIQGAKLRPGLLQPRLPKPTTRERIRGRFSPSRAAPAMHFARFWPETRTWPPGASPKDRFLGARGTKIGARQKQEGLGPAARQKQEGLGPAARPGGQERPGSAPGRAGGRPPRKTAGQPRQATSAAALTRPPCRDSPAWRPPCAGRDPVSSAPPRAPGRHATPVRPARRVRTACHRPENA